MTKKTNTKVPKKFAGVKVPKVLRDLSWADGMIHSNTGRKLLADALVAAAGAAAAALMKGHPSVKQTGQDDDSTAGAVAKRVAKAKKQKKKAAAATADTVRNLQVMATDRGGSGKKKKPSK